MTPIRVLALGYNHAKYTKQCLESLIHQDYPDWRLHWIDDASPDGGEATRLAMDIMGARPSSVAGIYLAGENNQHIIERKPIKRTGLVNFYEAALLANPGEVVFGMGGDDWLTRNDALSIVAREYDDPECWFTHGASWNSDGSGTFSGPCLHEDFRRHPFRWLPSSWRAELTSKVRPEDLQMQGMWMPSAGDVALYTPILEMCGMKRIRLIEECIYLYRKHENQDGALCQRLQDFCGFMARIKPAYSRLESLSDSPTFTPHILPYGVAFSAQLGHASYISTKLHDNGMLEIGPANLHDVAKQ